MVSMMTKEIQMTAFETKENQIEEAIKTFRTTIGKNYSYQAGYFETLVKLLLLRVNDTDREMVVKLLKDAK
jgi:hypothetical protein